MSGAGPIPFSAIDAWARRYGCRGDAFRDLHTKIRFMDEVYADEQSKRKPRGLKNKGKK